MLHEIAHQNLIKIPLQKQNRCLFYALQAALAHQIKGLDKHQFQKYRKSQFGFRGKLDREVVDLMGKVGAPLDEQYYDAEEWVPEVINYWNNEVHNGKYKIKAFFFKPDGLYKPCYSYGPTDCNISLVIYYDNNHFEGVYQPNALFGKPYCLRCEKCYNEPANHTIVCKARCKNCSRVGPNFPCSPEAGVNIFCHVCAKTFVSNDCYRHHIESNFCSRSSLCLKCGVIWDKYDNRTKGHNTHVCYEHHCKTCKGWHKKDDKRCCFIMPKAVPKKKPARFIAFDMECTQYEEIVDARTKKVVRKHQPNFISAKVCCQACIQSGEWKSNKMGAKCSICGPHRTATFSHRPFTQTYVDKQIVAENPTAEFAKWLLTELPANCDSYLFSHYGGRYDIHFVFVEMYKQNYFPDLVRRGNKLINMDIKMKNGHNLFFRDSFNLFPMALGALPSAFGLDVADKPYFPHRCNVPWNYGKVIRPSLNDYMAEGWRPEKYMKFREHFEKEGERDFILDEELASYCTNDTEILLCALVAFRREFMDISKRLTTDSSGNADRAGHFKEPHPGIDPLTTSSTIARACLNIFLANHLPVHHLALVPENGYDKKDRQSKIAYQALRYIAEMQKVDIQTAYSSELSEKRFGQYPVDGWIAAEKRVIEIQGCCYHGCPKCFPDDQTLLYPKRKTAGELRKRDADKKKYLLACDVKEVEYIWTCEIEERLKSDPEMKKKFAEYRDRSSLEIRDCFYGGRVGPFTLFHKAAPGERIGYFDFTSLYPYVNYMLEDWMRGYPVGHPKCHILNTSVNWRCSADNPYKLALIKAFVIPPRRCDIPVLPMKSGNGDDERLLFPLCAKCARQHPEGGVADSYTCSHSDEERGWEANCTSLELDVALDEGYRVSELIRVYEYDRADRDLFRGYMSEFLSLKIHASGFEKGIEGNEELEEKFIRECRERFGIVIDRVKMKTDKGKRSLAKLMVNNLWGRFAMRNYGLGQTMITDDPSVLGDMLDRNDIEILDVDEIIKGVIIINYSTKKEFIEENPASNVVVSLWTTSCARLLLLRAMQIVSRTPGCKLLYTDTDSLVFSYPENHCPLPLGPHIGEFTDEYPDHYIVEAVFGGAKQYGLKLRPKNNPNAPYEYCLKIRGITLSEEVINQQGLQYEKFKEMVLKYGRTGILDSISILYSNQLKPSLKKGGVFSLEMRKIWKPFIGKGIVRKSDLKILNFGHC